jgi:hypothetical protein
MARNGPEDAVPVALVETGRLEAARVEERRRAAAPAPLVLGELEEAAAHATPPELLRQEEQVDEEDAERGAAGDAAERRVRLRVARDDVERPAIRDPALLPVVASQASSITCSAAGSRASSTVRTGGFIVPSPGR